MEKGYPPADQYPPTDQYPPNDSVYPPTAGPPDYNPAAYPSDQYPPPSQAYPPPSQAYPPAAAYPAAYPTQPQPPPYDPGAAQQQQTTNTVVVTAAPQPATHIVHATVKPPNYIALSLINLLCCCWPLGIVGLIYSLRVDTEFNAGRYEEAKRASDSARSINYIGFGIGTFLIIGYIIIIIVANVVAASNSDDDY